MFCTGLGLRFGPSQLRKSDTGDSLTGRRPLSHRIWPCAHYRTILPRCSIATRLQAKSITQLVHTYRHGHTGGCTR